MIRVTINVSSGTMGETEIIVERKEIYSDEVNKLELTEALDEARARVDRAHELKEA